MFVERTSVGLDVHARSVAAAAIDTATRRVVQERRWSRARGRHRLAARPARSGRGDLRGRADRVRSRPGADRGRDPVRGRRAVEDSSAPAGDRVKTDAKDALLLARLLRIGRDHLGRGSPRVDQEAARDLVRAREDVRGDLMRARHRVSKLLLRHGHVYYGGQAWTGGTTRGCARSGSTSPAPGLPTRPTSKPSTFTLARRDRLDDAIAAMAADSEFTADRARAVLPARDLDPDRVRARGRDRRLGPVHRRQHRRLPRPGALRALQRRVPHARAGSPRPATATPGGCSSRPPGTTSPATPSARPSKPAGTRHPQPPASAATPATSDSTTAGTSTPPRKKKHTVANTAIARELAGWCWSLATLPDGM